MAESPATGLYGEVDLFYDQYNLQNVIGEIEERAQERVTLNLDGPAQRSTGELAKAYRENDTVSAKELEIIMEVMFMKSLKNVSRPERALIMECSTHEYKVAQVVENAEELALSSFIGKVKEQSKSGNNIVPGLEWNGEDKTFNRRVEEYVKGLTDQELEAIISDVEVVRTAKENNDPIYELMKIAKLTLDVRLINERLKDKKMFNPTFN